MLQALQVHVTLGKRCRPQPRMRASQEKGATATLALNAWIRGVQQIPLEAQLLGCTHDDVCCGCDLQMGCHL